MKTIPPVIEHVETHMGTIDPSAGYWRFPVAAPLAPGRRLPESAEARPHHAL